MARIEGVRPERAGWLARMAFRACKRKLGRVVEPVAIHAHHTGLLAALAAMALGQERARRVDARLKALASICAAMSIGCPF